MKLMFATLAVALVGLAGAGTAAAWCDDPPPACIPVPFHPCPGNEPPCVEFNVWHPCHPTPNGGNPHGRSHQ